ncbi:MAG: OmpA family protein [Burkholderiales bacterium]
MTQLKQLALAIALIGASCSTMAQSAAFNPSLYVQPSVNGFRPDSDFGFENGGKPLGYGGGLKFGKALSQHWDVQMGYVYGRASAGGQRLQQHLLGVDGLYLFSRDTFRPFLLIGVGAEHDRINRGNVFGGRKNETSAYVSGGVGFQAVLSDRITFQADLRDVHAFGGGKKFGDLNIDNAYLTVGLNIAFDAPPAPAPVAPPPVAPAMIPEPAPTAPPPPPPPARFEKVSLSATELFAFDSDKLSSNQPKLDDIANLLNANSSVTNVAISGYTDRLGNDNYNQKLSERRANAVKDYLISKGVAASRLNAVGKGKSNPVVECKDKNRAALIKCLEPNRRVEVEQITVERRVQ